MDSTKKLYLAIAVLGVLVGGVYLQDKDEKKVAATHSFEVQQAALPQLKVEEEAAKGIDSLELYVPPKAPAEGEEASETKGEKVVLVKKDEDTWELKEPVAYAANETHIASLIKNLGAIRVHELITTSTGSYEKWKLSDETGVHVVAKKGQEVLFDAYFGDNGSRGQMTRIAGKDGVYAVKGFSRYLYARTSDGWRDKSIAKFDDKEAVKVTVVNEHGTFAFEKVEEKWTGTHNGKAIDRFKESKVGDLLRAYKNLTATKFGDDKKPEDVGLVEPKSAVTIELKGGTAKHIVSVGDTAEGTARWVKVNGRDEVFSISSWAADWALAEVKKFQEKTEEEKAEATTKAP